MAMLDRPVFGMDGPRREVFRAVHSPPPWNKKTSPQIRSADPAYDWFPPARPRHGDSQEQGRARLAVNHALNLVPRDPRYYLPDREAGWVNTSSPLIGRYIPSYELNGGDDVNCVHQIEPFISRPTSRARGDMVAQRMALGKRTSPLISYNSIGWNRRHYEPVPDVVRVVPAGGSPHASTMGTVASLHSSRGMASPGSPGSPAGRPASRTISRGSSRIGSPTSGMLAPLSPDERELSYLEGYAQTSMGSMMQSDNSQIDPPRIEGVDTASRPPLLIHSTGKVRRPAWIGTRY